MATMIAAFVGKNREFRTYLEEQRTAEVFEAVRRFKQAAAALQSALPGVISTSRNGALTQVWLRNTEALEQIPGTVTVAEIEDKSYFRYRLSKHWQGVEFIAWAKEHEVQPVLGGAEIRKMAQEVAGNETD